MLSLSEQGTLQAVGGVMDSREQGTFRGLPIRLL